MMMLEDVPITDVQAQWGTKVLVLGLVGSKAYGIDNQDSDEDYVGCFMVDPRRILTDLEYESTWHTILAYEPHDCQVHELRKFVSLAAKANPTILESLFSPQISVSRAGLELVRNRHLFLSQKVRYTYGGYARQQMDRLQRRGDGSFSSDTRKRYAKHARHMFRLLEQGTSILETGELQVRVSDPERIVAMGKLPPDDLICAFEEEFAKFESIESSIREKPDYDKIKDVVYSIRSMYHVDAPAHPAEPMVEETVVDEGEWV